MIDTHTTASVPQNVLDKLARGEPHPWYGTANPRRYHKTAAAELTVLTAADKSVVYPSPSWADSRVVKMPKSQLQQMLRHNIMLPGEEAARIPLSFALPQYSIQ